MTNAEGIDLARRDMEEEGHRTYLCANIRAGFSAEAEEGRVPVWVEGMVEVDMGYMPEIGPTKSTTLVSYKEFIIVSLSLFNYYIIFFLFKKNSTFRNN